MIEYVTSTQLNPATASAESLASSAGTSAAADLDPGASAPRVHRAWWVALVAGIAIIGAAGFRATPGVLITPLQQAFGWSSATISSAVSVNLLLFGLTAPFAAAL